MDDDLRRLATDLGRDLAATGYTVDGVADLLGPVAVGALDREQTVPATRVVAEHPGEPLAAVVGALLLGRTTTRAALQAAVPGVGVDGLVRLGIVTSDGPAPDAVVRPRLEVSPHAGTGVDGTTAWWVVSDLSEAVTGRPLAPDHVLGVGGASTTLALATPRRPGARVLDLGTGCGVQALHVGRWARSVVATDVSRRALRLAETGLLASGTEVGPGRAVELRAGSLLEPVAGETFDLVVSNPPFVITPRAGGVPRYEYRDAGAVGDELVRTLVTSLARVLAPGGLAVLLGNWEVPTGAPWTQRVGSWVEESGLDAVVVQRERLDPAEYAELWLRDGGAGRAADVAAPYLAWLDDLASRHVEAVGLGLVVLRRPVAGRARVRRLEERTGPAAPGLGDHLAAVLAAQDLLADLGDDGVLAARWQVAPDVTEERHHRPGEADPSVIVLRSTAGFGSARQVPTVVAAVVGACDGELPLGLIAGAVAQLLEVETGSVVAQVLPTVRELVADGLLVSAGS